MIASIRESKARLSEFVALANSGEEVVITVRGKPSAKLVPIQGSSDKRDKIAWGKEISARLAQQQPPAPGTSSQEIIDQLREERF